jgi:Putative DNA-binding domain
VITKAIEDITIEDIQGQVDNRVPEGRALDYKEGLPASGDDARRELLADVASFANTAGGHILFGVAEERPSGRPTGIPAAVVGVAGNLDAEILKMDSAIRDSIDPRIPGVHWRRVPSKDGREVLVCFIPKSWQAPHMVTFRGTSRFYARSASGKFQLDVQQIRAAFIASETVREGIRRFRQERLAKIASSDGPVSLVPGPLFVLHLVPLASFDSTVAAGVDLAYVRATRLADRDDLTYRFNFDGLLGFKQDREHCWGYVQVFRNGAIEAVEHVDSNAGGNRKTIVSINFEHRIIKRLAGHLEDLRKWRVPGPLLLMLSLLGVSGYEMAGLRGLALPDPEVIDRDILVMPESLLEQIPEPSLQLVAGILHDAFDVTWQAAGWPHSPNFNAEGAWIRG